INSVSYFKDDTRQKMKIIANIVIRAEAYKRKFNFKMFKYDLIFYDEKEIYNGYIFLTDSLINTNYNLVNKIITTSSIVDMKCALGERYDLKEPYNDSTLNITSNYDINFDDEILRQNAITSLITHDIYIKPDIDGSGEIIFYVIAR